MLHIKHQIIDGKCGSPLDIRVILGLDLTNAFDNVHDGAILEGLERPGMGKKNLQLRWKLTFWQNGNPSGWKH